MQCVLQFIKRMGCSHSHGQNGLSSCDGDSCLITFSNLDDLLTYGPRSDKRGLKAKNSKLRY